MKRKIYLMKLFVAPLLLFGILSCEKDNYDAPAASLSGKIVDIKTGGPVPQQTITGGILRLFQTDITDNAVAITSYFHSDGTYDNKLLFDGNYRVVVDGPFFYDDTLNVQINGMTELDIPVRPYLYVMAEVLSKTENSVKIKVNVELGPDNTEQQIARIALVADKTESLDVNYFDLRELTDTEGLDNNEITTTDHIFELTDLDPKSTYFIRAAARTINTGSHYNYAPMLTITTE